MRPRSIMMFEILFLLSLLIGLVQVLLFPPNVITTISTALVLKVQLGVVLVMLALMLLISLGRSKIAKWALTVMFALGLPLFLKQLAGSMPPGQAILGLGQALIQGCGLAALFTSTAREWFAR